MYCTQKVVYLSWGSLLWLTFNLNHIWWKVSISLGCHLYKFCALYSGIDSWKNISVVIFVRIIQSQFIGTGACNKLINLSNKINCTMASIYPDYHCIYTMRKPSEYRLGNWSTCGCLWAICWLWDTSSHQTAIKPVCIPLCLSITICSVLSEPVWDCQWEIQLWRYDSWERHLPSTSCTAQTFFPTLKHSHSAEWVSERGLSSHRCYTSCSLV